MLIKRIKDTFNVAERAILEGVRRDLQQNRRWSVLIAFGGTKVVCMNVKNWNY
jgi:hypothetical protein